MKSYPHLAARVFNTPLLIHPQKLDAIIAGLGTRLLGAPLEQLKPAVEGDGAGAEMAADLFSTRRGERVREAGWPGYKVIEGVALVHAGGALVHRTKLDADSELLLGYNDLATAREHAADNADVHAVLTVWDSPGGEAQGAFEYADRMFSLRGKKPSYSIADGMAASAALLGASADDELIVTTTGYAGSIGVVMRHVDFSRMLANEGIAVTHIFAGAHKVDGNPYEALPAAVRADFQAEINELYGMFVRAVARHTGMTEEAVRATQARTFMGQAAVDVGLARRLSTADAVLAELAELRNRSFSVGQPARFSTANDKGASMSGNTTAADKSTANQPAALTQADIDKARAEGRDEGSKAERERCSGILAHKEADGRGALAVQCIATGLSVEQAGALMAAAPKASATGAAAGSQFSAAMTALGNPDVRAGEGGQPEAQEDSPQAVASMWDRAFGVGNKRGAAATA